MDSRNPYHLLWTSVALMAFAVGYAIGSVSGNRRASETLVPASATASRPIGERYVQADNELSRTDADPTRTGSTPEGGVTDSSITEKPATTLVERAAQAMLTGSDLRRQRTFLAVLEEMQPGDAVAIHSLLARATSQGVTYVNQWEQFWTRWGEIDGTAAMEFVLKNQQGALQKDSARVMRG